MSAFDKLEYELYAPLSLMHSFPQFVQSLSKGESPDWQDHVHGIGIEVARAEDKHLGYSKHFWNTYRGKDKGEIPASELSRFEGYLEFDDNNKLIALSPYKDLVDGETRIGLVDGSTHIQLACEKSITKLQLLNSENFRQFNTNCLYLFLTMLLSEDDSINFLKQYSETASNYQVAFNFVFLMTFEDIYCCDLSRNSFQRHTFSETELASFDDLVHKLRQASDWKEGTSFVEVLSANCMA